VNEWQVHVDAGAHAGLVANDLAAAGVIAVPMPLMDRLVFFSTVVGRKASFTYIAADFDPSQALEENCIKKYPVSGICWSVHPERAFHLVVRSRRPFRRHTLLLLDDRLYTIRPPFRIDALVSASMPAALSDLSATPNPSGSPYCARARISTVSPLAKPPPGR
jgi:hypothetical protein